MKRFVVAGVLSVGLMAPLLSVPAGAAPGDVAVSDRTYVRYDGGTDPVLAACSTNNRQQNEPTASVAPHNPALMSSGSNDYCTVPTTGGTWAGFYYSGSGGTSWTNSLLPGYPGDTSPAGTASPLQRIGVTNAGDPVQAWDNDGHLYYAGIGFNRGKPALGSIWVARYGWPGGASPSYQFTTLVERGTPSPIFLGLFHDKIQLEVDRGADSPYEGNVYVCWARFTASGPNNGVFLARSSDGGQTFSSQKVSESVHGSQFCDIAVTRDGDVYVAWRQFEFRPNQGQLQGNAVAWVKSVNGGKSFTKPAVATGFIGWDPGDQTVSAPAYGQAKYDACLVGDGTLGACASPEPRAFARDCGDGPLACQSGYVFHRANSQVRITADPTTSGDPDEVFLVYDGTVPGTQASTGTTYGTISPGTGSQASIYFLRTSTGGGAWSTPARIDSQADGHQYFPDIVAEAGQLHAVWQDSRFDAAVGPGGRDFRSVPVGNRAVPANPPGGVSAGPGLAAFYATSADDGASWTTSEVTTARTMPQYEQFGNRDVPFFGDYNYIAASGTTVFMTWTDHRDVVAGTDPRYPIDGVDGFDVLQCRAANPDGTFGPDTCPNNGGLDQNIYGAVR
ncbi:sialidase family protein [Kribbella catacumbae]|uniref:sialidase family protein n=1 Tax=Kribbella catacumbae TaxID=460086 RepID=UPI0012FCFED4|nr:sialidase family protein [Kribbella catacumbae]